MGAPVAADLPVGQRGDEQVGERGTRKGAVAIGGRTVAPFLFVTALMPFITVKRTPNFVRPWMLAVIAGVLLVSQGGHAHGEYSGEAHGEVAESVSHIVLDLALELAPALLIGLLLTAFVQSFRDHESLTIVEGESSLRQALRGALGGITVPIVTSAVLPASEKLRKRGAGAALVMAFMLTAPQVGLDSSFVHGRFLGWQLSLVRVSTALGMAIALALVMGRLTRQPTTRTDQLRDLEDAGEDSQFARGVGQADALFLHLLPPMILGLLAASYVDVALEAGDLERFTRGSLDILRQPVRRLDAFCAEGSVLFRLDGRDLPIHRD